jgi:hypothetical protein
MNRKELEDALGWIPALILMVWGFIFALYVIGKELSVEKRLKQLEWKKNGEKEKETIYLLYYK